MLKKKTFIQIQMVEDRLTDRPWNNLGKKKSNSVCEKIKIKNKYE